MSFFRFFTGARKKEEGSTLPLPMSEDRFLEMAFFTEEREVRSHLTDVAGKKVLEISPRQRPLSGFFREKGAALVARLGGAGDKEASLLSHLENLPFLDASLDLVLVRPAFLKGAHGRLLRETSRILASGGAVLVSDLHPFSVMVQKEHLGSPAGEEGMGPGFERYFKLCREAGLHLRSVRELFFEGSLRKFFVSAEEKKVFEGLRRTPFLIFFLLNKD